MPRRNTTFTVDAESVQGNAGATVTFRAITVGQRQEYLESEDINDIVMLRSHVLRWSGIVDDQDNPLPDPQDDPAVIDALYLDEMRAMTRLLWQGPLEDSVKN